MTFGLGVARHHAEQDGFAHAGTGERPMRWPRPTVSSVDGADADVERLFDRCPRHRVDRPALQRRRCRRQGRGHRAGDPLHRRPGPARASPTGISLARSMMRRRGCRGLPMRGSMALVSKATRGRRERAIDVLRRHQVELFRRRSRRPRLRRPFPAGMMRQELPSGSLRPLASMTRPLMRSGGRWR